MKFKAELIIFIAGLTTCSNEQDLFWYFVEFALTKFVEHALSKRK